MPTLREGTSDAWVWKSVFTGNEYGLLDLRGRTAVDIGANIGAFSCLAAEKGATRVIAVEPFGPNFEVLTSNIAGRPGVTAIRRAVGAVSGEMITMRTTEEFVEAAQDAADKPVNFGGFHIGDHVGGSDSVATIALPDLMREHGLERIDVLKLDCESAEWPLLQALKPADFARIGEICGEYHLVGNVSVLANEGDPLVWLRRRLESNGFQVELSAHATNARLGWFYARNAWVGTPACEFMKKANAKAPAKPAAKQPTIESLEKRVAQLEKNKADLEAKLGTIASRIDVLEKVAAPIDRWFRKARKLQREPLAFFRDAGARRGEPR